MAFFGQQGGAAPGAARNSLSQYPPKGTGFAATKPPVPPPGGYRYGAMPKPPQYGRARPDVPVGAPTFPSVINDPGFSHPGARPDVPVGAPTFPSVINDPGFSHPGATTGQGEATPSPVGTFDNTLPDQRQRMLEKQMRQDQRRINRTGINDPYSGGAMDTAPAAAPAAAPTGAARPGMEYRQDRRQAARQAARQAGLEDPAMADGPNQQWRADRRQAERQGLVEQNADGSYNSTQPADPNGQGAQRDGMGWRAERRQAVKDGTYTPPTGADRNGFGYRQDRRQARRRYGRGGPRGPQAGGDKPGGPPGGGYPMGSPFPDPNG